MHEYPLSIVDHEQFRIYCDTLQPMFNMPSRNTIKKDILDMFEKEKEKTLSKLEVNEGRIAITTDMWTDDHQNRGYMAVTAHYIDDEWTLQKCIIRFEYVPTPHTSDVIATCLMKCFLDWNIDRKLTAITVDNCSVNDGVVELLVDRLANLYFSSICSIKVALKEWILHSDDTFLSMSKRMLDKFDKYWSKVNGIMGVATLLDPRYKTTLLEYYFEDIYGPSAEFEVERIVQLCQDLVNEYREKLSPGNEAHFSSTTSCNTTVGGKERLKKYDAYVSLKKQKKSKVVSELDRYLEEDVIPRTPNFDILVWWKINGPQFPILKDIAKDIYAIPVSTVASKSTFRLEGDW
ncbi:hypothetical protein GQ457_12G003440 [Hibiscus cannabinus]